jgi:hypothetical protein
LPIDNEQIWDRDQGHDILRTPYRRYAQKEDCGKEVWYEDCGLVAKALEENVQPKE